MRKSFWFWAAFVWALIMAVYFCARLVMTVTGAGALAHVRSVSLSADTNRNLAAVSASLGVAPGTRTFGADLHGIAVRVGNVPGVAAASVRRMPNGNLSVKIKSHTAVALWTDDMQFFPVTANGTIINTPLTLATPGAVVFRGPMPADISDMAKHANPLSGHMGHVEWIEGRRWNIVTTSGATIMLPESHPESAIAALLTMDKNHKIMSRDWRVLDMRDAARILIK